MVAISGFDIKGNKLNIRTRLIFDSIAKDGFRVENIAGPETEIDSFYVSWIAIGN